VGGGTRQVGAFAISCERIDMSALGQKRTLSRFNPMSALPPKADIVERDRHVRFVPKPDINATHLSGQRLDEIQVRV